MNREIAACAACASLFFYWAIGSAGTFEAWSALLMAGITYAQFWEKLSVTATPKTKTPSAEAGRR